MWKSDKIGSKRMSSKGRGDRQSVRGEVRRKEGREQRGKKETMGQMLSVHVFSQL